MHLHIKLSTTLRDYVPGYEPEKGLHLEVPDGMTVGELARYMGLPPEEIKIVMVNGRHSEVDDAMRDGDRIAFFPAVGGG